MSLSCSCLNTPIGIFEINIAIVTFLCLEMPHCFPLARPFFFFLKDYYWCQMLIYNYFIFSLLPNSPTENKTVLDYWLFRNDSVFFSPDYISFTTMSFSVFSYFSPGYDTELERCDKGGILTLFSVLDMAHALETLSATAVITVVFLCFVFFFFFPFQ